MVDVYAYIQRRIKILEARFINKLIGPSWFSYRKAATSIYFEIWGVVHPAQRNFDFSRQISEKFRFSQAKIAHLLLLLGKLFYFSSYVSDSPLSNILPVHDKI